MEGLAAVSRLAAVLERSCDQNLPPQGPADDGDDGV